MPPDPALRTTDLDQFFRDWAEPVTLRLVVALYDPATARLEPTHTDRVVVAIPGPATNSLTPGTAGQDSTLERTFLLRAEDLPPHLAPSTRILHADHEYSCLTWERSADDALLLLRCRARP